MPYLVCDCQDCLMLTYWKMTRNVRVRVCVAVLTPSLDYSSEPDVENKGRDDCTSVSLKGRNKMYRCNFGSMELYSFQEVTNWY